MSTVTETNKWPIVPALDDDYDDEDDNKGC
jgi:hypothetical protein